ncbi:MAG: Cyclic di-GMP phosphodiesterase response regulator RpfG [Candidatus Izimaplasma bacterium HR2]|nr:MAG: Cyclic di-GMP phosphodiesterase response regulator RpfG [Candidatus Izimaplasma bacterium HR2]
MNLTKVELQGTDFNGVLASVCKYNRKTKEFLFTKNSLLMFGLKGILEQDKWYGTNDKIFKHVFLNQIENYNELKEYLNNFTSLTLIDFKIKLVFTGGKDSFYLEGLLDGEIIVITAIETEVSKQIDFLSNEGLINSKIGLRWIERISGEYRIFHMDSSRELYGILAEREVSRIIFRKEWEVIKDKILKDYPEYQDYFDNNIEQFNDLVSGKNSSYILTSPWLDSEENIVWVEDRVTVLSRNDEGYAELIVAITIDVTESKLKEFSFDRLEERNKQLLDASKRAINLAELLVWMMNFDDFPDGDYIISNKRYKEVLGLDSSKNGYVKFEDFLKTTYPDILGKNTMDFLLNEFDRTVKNEIDEFEGVVKHQNLKTKEVVYLEHHSRVEERNIDGSLRIVGGYIVNITDRIKMEETNKLLNLEKERHLSAERLAVRSGRIMIWYLSSKSTESADSFYGNKLLFTKLGLTDMLDNQFSIKEFNESIYQGDDEGLKLHDIYFAMDDKVESGEIDYYDKLLVKHQNLKTKEIFYFEHNFEVEKRFSDGSLMIRGGFMADVTEEIKYKKRNDYLVGHDAVTGLLNRTAFEEYIESSLMPNDYSLIIADIDGLKFINDAFGHIKGDEAIDFVGNQLETECGKISTVYRIGGDEFAVISTETDENNIISHINMIKENIAKLNLRNDIQLGVSVGYEIVKNSNILFSDAFINAENLMYRRKLQDRNSRKSKTMDAVLETLHIKTEETKEHCDRLGVYAVNTLKQLGYTRVSDLEDIELLCKVHDIGKITISEEILSKEGELTKEEYNKIKGHSESGYKIVKNIVESDRIAFGVLYHHERVDGKGYPFGLKGDEIPLFAKILNIVDAYDVMITGRKYSKAVSKEEAIKEIIACSGTQFDKKIADKFIMSLKEED